MAKSLKRAGIVFFAFVLSLLLVLGTMYATNAVENNSNSIVNTNLQNNEIAENNDSENVQPNENVVYNIPKSEYEINLGHKANCTNQTTCYCMQDIWNEAIQKSLDTGKNVKVTLLNDWIADETTHSFGDGVGFGTGRIYFPKGCNITLDFCGNVIDRALTEATRYGSVIRADECKINLIDSTYDSEAVYNAYAANPDTDLSTVGAGGITGGYEYSEGGGLYLTNVDLVIDGIMIFNNKSRNHGGGIYALSVTNITMYDGLIINNQTQIVQSDGSAICAYSQGKVNLFGGIIHNNTTCDASALNLVDNSLIVNLGGKLIISKNTAGGWGGAIRANVKEFNMTGGIIEYNSTTSAGGGIMFNGGINNISGGTIRHNSAYLGSGICLTNGDVTLSNCIIEKNTDTHAGGGGVAFDSANQQYGSLKIGAGTQIYDNTCAGAASDIMLYRGQSVGIVSTLMSGQGACHIGINLANGYEGAFTYGYSMRGNRAIEPSRFFFSNAQNKKVVLNGSEVEIQDKVEGDAENTDLVWKYNATELSGKSNATVVYTGANFVVSANGTNIYKVGESTASTAFTVTDAGSYSFYAQGNYKNPTFTLTILPKEVDVIWSSNILTYNGNLQAPTASIAEDSDCKVTVINSYSNAGSGYIAVATGLSNTNYKISLKSQTKYFVIQKAKVQDVTGTETFVLDGKTHTFMPAGFNSSLMSITGNTATLQGEYSAKISLLDTGNYEWVSGGSEPLELKFVIENKSMIKNNVYDYLYLENDGDKIVRKSYSENGIYRQSNDGEIVATNGNKLIIGNIAPYTSVNSFLDNLLYDKAQINLYNSQDKLIYTNGTANAAEGITEDMLNSRFELAVGTGWYMECNIDGETETVYLSVLGDINGDGRITASDVTYLRELANDTIYDNLDVEFKLAALIINKGSITSADSEIIVNVINKKLTIDLFY